VQIPVRLSPRERADELALHQLDRRDRAPIGYERVNKATGKPVAWGDVVKGYEVSRGEYVLVTDDDFEKANVEATRSIEIEDFVGVDCIAPAFFDRPYVLMPDRAPKAYAVLRDTLLQKRLAGIGLVVLRSRQHLCAVIAEGGVLLLELLRFAHELRPLPTRVAEARPTAKELQLAEQLIERMVVDWDPGKYKDRYRDDLLAAIHEKAKTGVLEPKHLPPSAPRAKAMDLADLLSRSLHRGPKRPARRRAA
jgi:DNA end-binding protein Ku